MHGRTPDLLAALGKRDGQEILARLVARPARVSELAEPGAGVRQPTVSRRLGELEAIGLVSHRRRKDLYSLTDPVRLRPLLRARRRNRDTALWVALGRPHAIELVLALMAKPSTPSELADAAVGLDLRTVSRRVSELAAVGALRPVVGSRAYQVRSPARMRMLLGTLSELATDLLDADLAAERSLRERLGAPS